MLLISQHNSLLLRALLSTFALLRKVTFGFIISVRLPVRPARWTVRLQLYSNWWNFTLTIFLKICREDLSLIKISHDVKT